MYSVLQQHLLLLVALAVTLRVNGKVIERVVANFGADGEALGRLPVVAASLVAVEGAGGSAEAITEELAGKVALINRGQCAFTAKAKAAQDKGAVAVIIANNRAGPPMAMGFAGEASRVVGATITIAVLGVSQADGATLRGMAGAVVDVRNEVPAK